MANPIMEQVFAAIDRLGNVHRTEIDRFVVAAYGGDDQAVYDTYIAEAVDDLECAIVAHIEYRESRGETPPADDGEGR